MAALASSAVSVSALGGSGDFFPFGKGNRDVVGRRLKINLAQGDQTDTIGAAALGFKQLLWCSNLFDGTNNKVYLAVVDPVGNMILLGKDGADTSAKITAAATYITVFGTPKLAR